MGTRGLLVVYQKNKYYACSNSCDSYPSELGRKVYDALCYYDVSSFKKSFLSLADGYPNIQKSRDFEDVNRENDYAWMYFVDISDEQDPVLTVTRKDTLDFSLEDIGDEGEFINALEKL